MKAKISRMTERYISLRTKNNEVIINVVFPKDFDAIEFMNKSLSIPITSTLDDMTLHVTLVNNVVFNPVEVYRAANIKTKLINSIDGVYFVFDFTFMTGEGIVDLGIYVVKVSRKSIKKELSKIHR